jgi:hypothetical protein
LEGGRQGFGSKPGRTWVLGCYSRGDRQQWMEAILNAQRPADEQVCVDTVIKTRGMQQDVSFKQR